MPINRFFLSYMAIAGVATGIVLVIAPEVRNFKVPPDLDSRAHDCI